MPSDDTITQHLECHACRYDLKGLPRSGRCPECGLFIAFTLEQRHTDEYFAEQDKDMKEYRERAARADALLAAQESDVARWSALLARWEAIQSRIERVLDRLES
ncbi:MAG: hypothetical protein IT431_04990 [Phycisphaerales bacterium]|nr:hypothetical protein [Phycisphaerales bacterium]